MHVTTHVQLIPQLYISAWAPYWSVCASTSGAVKAGVPQYVPGAAVFLVGATRNGAMPCRASGAPRPTMPRRALLCLALPHRGPAGPGQAWQGLVGLGKAWSGDGSLGMAQVTPSLGLHPRS